MPTRHAILAKRLAIPLGLVFSFLIYSNAYAYTYSGNLLTNTANLTCDSEYGGSDLCNNLLDGNTATVWTSTNTSFPHWIKYDLGSGKYVGQLKIYEDINYRIKNFTFQVSNNDSTWFTIGTETYPQTVGWQTYDYGTTTAYRYVRVYGTDNWGATNYMGADEWQLFECTDCGTAATTTTSTAQESFFEYSIYELHALIVLVIAFGTKYLLTT